MLMCYYAVIPPTIDIILDTGAQLAATAGTRVSLLGMARLDPLVDSQVTVSTSWTRQGSSDQLIFNESVTPPYIAALNFELLSLRDAGDYVFMVTVSPFNPTSVQTTPTVSANYTFNVERYPDMVIMESVRSGQCGMDAIATLMGSVNLLPHVATSHDLSYTWTGPNGQIPASTDLLVNGGMLVVRNLSANLGYYNLTVCLTFPDANVEDTCSTVDYHISIDG